MGIYQATISVWLCEWLVQCSCFESAVRNAVPSTPKFANPLNGKRFLRFDRNLKGLYKIMVVAPPKSATQGQGRRRRLMLSYPTSRTGFTAFRWWFSEVAKPQTRLPGWLPGGGNCLRSAFRGFLGGRFIFVDKSYPDYPLPENSDT